MRLFLKILFPVILSFLFACEYSRIEQEIDCASVTPVLSVSVQPTACTAPSGSAEVTAQNVPEGAVIEYSLNGSAYTTDNIFSDLAAGNYSIQARLVESECTSLLEIFSVSEEGDGCNG